ncbi:MAG: tetratricopeptide repeat protein [Phycisphaerales bacterium]
MSALRSRVRDRAFACAAAALACAVTLSGCATGSGSLGERARARERVVLAESLTEEGRYEDALRELAMAIRENPTLTTAHLEMGDIYRTLGDYPAAEIAYRNAATQEPENFDAQYNHAITLQVLNRLAEAVRAYLRALEIRPYDTEANLNIATAYLQLEEARQALPYGRRAVALDPANGPARVNLGAILSALGRHDEAVTEYQAAAERMELTAPLLLNLADSLGKAGRYREMATTLTQLVEIEPSAQAHERLGFALFRLGRYEDALDAFRASAQMDSTHYPAFNGIGVCLLNDWLVGGQTDEATRRAAIEALRRSVRINRAQPRVVDLLARYG